MDIQQHLNDAKKILMPAWPLQAFIANNPLWQLTNQPFIQVACQHPHWSFTLPAHFYREAYLRGDISIDSIKAAKERMDYARQDNSSLHEWALSSFEHWPSADSRPSLLYAQQILEYRFQPPVCWIQEQLFTYLKNYFYQTKHTELLSYAGTNDPSLEIDPHQSINTQIETLLRQLAIPDDIQTDYLKLIYSHLYGWSSFLFWQQSHPNNPWIKLTATPEAILLLWLSYEKCMHSELGQPYQPMCQSINAEQIKMTLVWQLAYEIEYIQSQYQKFHLNQTPVTQPQAQLVFCIDTRSEGLRRHLESLGNYETFGVAGFFGLPFNLHDGSCTTIQSPALVSPDLTITTTPLKPSFMTQLRTAVKKSILFSKQQLTTPFVLFEILGIWYACRMLYETFHRQCSRPQQPSIRADNLAAISTSDAAMAAANLLTGIGLTQQFSSAVILCGHASHSTNNPYAASLNCGACGGNGGQANAQVMAHILNEPAVRDTLKTAHRIDIPESTQFIAACHHTTDDAIEILTGSPSSTLIQDLNVACKQLKDEKRLQLPGHQNLARRESDWSELIPETGLLNNSLFIIGPRKYTRSEHFDRRAFLNSYCPESDPEGNVLASILAAPAIVGHWINAQYYFSTVCPNTFSAGNKAIHNVLPNIGVMAGNLSDLKIGLPEQSVLFQDHPFHEPRRLLVVVYATATALQKALEKTPQFKQLIDNQWIHFHHVEVTS